MADVLACGRDAGLGATTTLQLMGALRENDRRTVVITARRGRRPPRGVDLRTSRDVDFVTYDGIPTTTLQRALADAAPALADEQLEAAYEKAVVKLNLHPSLIPQRNSRLNRLINDHEFCSALTGSELENLFRKIIKRSGLPQPQSNQAVWTGERHVYPDFLWRDRRLVAEIEGWQVHRDQHEADTLRKAELSAIGFVVVEFTKLMLVRHAARIPRALRPFSSSGRGPRAA